MTEQRPVSNRRVEWVATPPGGLRPRRRPQPRRRYTGPPSYPAVPRWGFPLLSWRWPLALPARPRVDPAQRVEVLGATVASMLWITASVAAGAAAAEAWRYVLLIRSRGEALPKTTLAISDALVATTGVLTWLLALVSAITVVLWALRARTAAAERIGVLNQRPDWQVIVGVLVPGLNLFVPGSALAELEHATLVGEQAREHGTRPTPSKLVLVWWAAWAASVLLGTLTFLWGFRDGVQAMADGVGLHVWNDVSVVVLAVVTVRVVNYLTALLAPVDATLLPRLRVLGVHDAPAPSRAQRPPDAAR